jgi:hypothetical protein
LLVFASDLSGVQLKKINVCAAASPKTEGVALSLFAVETSTFPILHVGRVREVAAYTLESLCDPAKSLFAAIGQADAQ